MPGDGAFTLSDEADVDPTTAALPHRLRLLWISSLEPSWVALALRLDAEGCAEPQFRWTSTAAEALAALRHESFDCVVAGTLAPAPGRSAEDELTALLRAVRGGGYGGPLVLVGPQADDRLQALLCELDCEVLLTPRGCDSPALLPCIRRAVRNAERLRENQRLSIVHQRRLSRERDEAEHLLQQQRGIIAELDWPPAARVPAGTELEVNLFPSASMGGPVSVPFQQLPEETREFYHELLRTYVIMGSGSLASEIASFADLLVAAGIGPRQALQFHLERVETLVGDLGNRSARHVMARADLLALELMVHVGEGYRRAGNAASSIVPPCHL